MGADVKLLEGVGCVSDGPAVGCGGGEAAKQPAADVDVQCGGSFLHMIVHMDEALEVLGERCKQRATASPPEVITRISTPVGDGTVVVGSLLYASLEECEKSLACDTLYEVYRQLMFGTLYTEYSKMRFGRESVKTNDNANPDADEKVTTSNG